MNFGLSTKEIEILTSVFEKTSGLEAVFIYGPRTAAQPKKSTELSLVVRFKSSIDEAGHLAAVLNDLLSGYSVKVIDERDVLSGKLKAEYEKTRQVFWEVYPIKKIDLLLLEFTRKVKKIEMDTMNNLIKYKKISDLKKIEGVKKQIH